MTAFNAINVQQAFFLCTFFFVVSCATAAVRLLWLSSVRQYRPFLGVFVIWAAFSVVAISVPVSSRLYFQIFCYGTPLVWLVYLFVARKLYQEIFDRYRGIAFAGRWCIYLAAFLLFASGVSSVVFSRGHISPSVTFATIIFIDRCLLFGISFFLLLLVGVIIRYPISIQKNLVVHCLCFSAILFFQSICQVAQQWTLYSHTITMLWNTLAAAFDTVCVSTWVLLLTKAGDNTVVRIRQHIQPEMEIHLLGQLDALNGMLLRAARK